jgi:hypothetical protein
MATATEEWIGVKEIADEMGMSERGAWELVRKWCVVVSHPHSRQKARFRRSDFEEARERGLKAPIPRKPITRATISPARVSAANQAADFTAKLAQLKSGKRPKA